MRNEKKEKKKGERQSRDWGAAVARLLPDGLTGRRKVMEQRFRGAYTAGDAEELIQKAKEQTAVRYLLLVLALLLSALLVWQEFSAGEKGLGNLRRAGFGGEVKVVDAEAVAKYGGENIQLPMRLKIQPKEASPEIIAKRLEDLKERLPAMILGENPKTDCIVANLNLPVRDEKTGIDLSWQSDRETVIDEQGKVNFIEGKAGEGVVLTARLRCGEAGDELKIPLTLGDPDETYDFTPDIRATLTGIVDQLNNGTEGDRLILPGETASGLHIRWRAPRDLSILAFPAFLLLLFPLIFRRRYALIDRDISRFRDSIRREFPDFLGKLLLLINAGMVVTGAVNKIAADYREHRRPGEEKPFYEELCGMEGRMRGSNTTLTAEFSDMAGRSCQREVMRFSTILADNIDKGATLAEKLSRESDMLWNLRKKRAEEKGRIAETKLTFPMVLQLLVVIVITVAPAAFEMG
jgi:hypothetical protein